MTTDEKRPELSFDGVGVNGPDEFRSRLAAFATEEQAQKYGPMFAASPDMLAVLRKWQEFADANYADDDISWMAESRAAIAKATTP